MEGMSLPSDNCLHQQALETFQTAVTTLLANSGHWNANYSAIIKANLRLLHDTLLHEPAYRYQIKRLLHHAENVPNPVKQQIVFKHLQNYPLHSSTIQTLHHAINCQRRSLVSNGNERLLIMSAVKASLITIPEGQLIHLCNPSSGISFFMPVMGKLSYEKSAETPPVPQNSWWHRLTHSCPASLLKTGDVLSLAAGENNDRMLIAERHSCILLCISMTLPLKPPTVNDAHRLLEFPVDAASPKAV